LKYCKVQGFQVVETWSYPTNIAPERIIETEYIDFFCGLLTIKAGFCFEPSGPTFKTKNFMRGACVHDAIYFLIRNRHLEPEWKEVADDLLYEINRKDGMSRIRANWIYRAVSTFGDSSIDPANRIKIQTAP